MKNVKMLRQYVNKNYIKTMYTSEYDTYYTLIIEIDNSSDIKCLFANKKECEQMIYDILKSENLTLVRNIIYNN